MSLSHAGCAARACAPIFRKTPPHVHPIINMAADVCPVLPKFHPSRNLNSMGASLWNKFEKECPFAKVVQKNISGSPQQSSAARLPHLRPERLPTRSEQPLVAEEAVCPIQAEAPKKVKPAKRTSRILPHRQSHFSLPSLFLLIQGLPKLLSSRLRYNS